MSWIEETNIALAIRHILDDVSYSNPLPEWFEVISIDYNARRRQITSLIDRLSASSSKMARFTISAPKRAGRSNVWVVPTINEQIALHACILRVSDSLESACDHRVFSYKRNRDPNRLSFLDDQLHAWGLFKAAISDSCFRNECLLQIDLKNAYGSTPCSRIRDYLNQQVGSNIYTGLIYNILDSLSADGSLPFINDSVFYLGNSYLSVVDAVVRRVTKNYVRFVDDYKIFGRSTDELETTFRRLRAEFRSIGYEINDGKVFIGTVEDYLNASFHTKYSTSNNTSYSAGISAKGDAFDPSALLGRVRTVVENPDDYLNHGFGRMVMGAIRRMRLWSAFSNIGGYLQTPYGEFVDLFSSDKTLLEMIADRIAEYSNYEVETWRLVWLLHLCASLGAEQRMGGRSLEEICNNVIKSDTVSRLSQLWAANVMRGDIRVFLAPEQGERLHQLGYLERGAECCRSPRHE